MRVQNIILSKGGEQIGQYSADIVGILRDVSPEVLIEDDFLGRVVEETTDLLTRFYTGEADRVAFTGMVPRGRAGITLSRAWDTLLVGGHKIDPLPGDASTHFLVFNENRLDDAFKEALAGLPVMLTCRDHAFAMRWDPFAFEVYGKGIDSL